MSEKKWQAAWIGDSAFAQLAPRNVFCKQNQTPAEQPHRDDLLDHHTLLRKEFVLAAVPAAAFLDITADDFYRLYVNGGFVGEGPANSYHFRYRYDRLDLAGLLVPGRNVIAVQVYYQGLANRVWVSADYRQGLIAELVDDTGRVLLCTDHSWRMLQPRRVPGARIGYDTQFLENIDARSWPAPEWREPDYDDRGWLHACVRQDDDHCLVRSEIPPLSFNRLRPIAVTELPDGGRLCDFGTEVTGYFSCAAYGGSGVTVRIRHGEELAPDGRVLTMRCNCDYAETWTLSGRAPERLEYTDYKAFRYVEVLPAAGVRLEDFSVLSRHYPIGECAANFKCEDPLLQGMWDICARALTVSSQSGFLDCPSREKGQYLGDMTVTAHAHLYHSGDARLYRKGLLDFADSAFICPGLMAVAPAALMQEIADYSLQYPQQLLTFYRYTGDIGAVRAFLPAAEAMMAYFRRYERCDGLLQNVCEKWNLVDWPANLRDGYDFNLDPKTPGEKPHAVLNAFYAAALEVMHVLRGIVGVMPSSPCPHYLRVAAAFQQAFYRPSTKLFVDSEISVHSSLHSNALALYAGLVPADSVETVVAFIMQKGFSCGVYMSYFVLKALARAGRHRQMYDLLTNRSEHSWANMLREGASSCFEAWGKEQKWNTSLCHPWASAPLPVFIEDWLGLYPEQAGYATIGLHPKLQAQHPDFTLTLVLPAARVEVIKKDDELRLRITPDGRECGLLAEGKELAVNGASISSGLPIVLSAEESTVVTFRI